MNAISIRNKNKIYWLSQIIGWGILVLLDIFFTISFRGLDWRRVIISFYWGFVGISFSHCLRIIIKRQKWLELPFKNLAIRIIGSNLIIAIIFVALIMGVSYFSGVMNTKEFKILFIPANIINTSSLLILWSIIYFAIHYFENYKQSEIERLVWEAAVKDYELKTLKSQLNPHFMFNALNSIRALVDEDPEKAKFAISQLSSIFRYSLKMEKMETVPLEEEINIVRNYLELEHIRYEERLNYKIKVDPKSTEIEIPPMMIQTLVENGIKHGISKIPDGGKIEISSDVIDSNVSIKIKNTGNINKDELNNLNGYGIKNTKQRLDLLYGEKAMFNISNQNGSVLTEIIIPMKGKK